MYLDNKWYGVDATFDDPIISGMQLISNLVRHTYMLKGSKVFSKSHEIDSTEILEFEVNYPELEEGDY